MAIDRRVINNRVLLLGLDKLYRDAMKIQERGELLTCARRVAGALRAPPANVPVEGYYAEDGQLTEYFLLVRALQAADGSARSAVDSLPEFRRLLAVTAAPLYGRPHDGGKLLPTGLDPLSQALEEQSPALSVTELTTGACRIARATDDVSLVGLAARASDAVALAAVRESVVLYAAVMPTAALHPPRPEYIWEVDADLARQAKRFIDTFNQLFDGDLPAPVPAQAERYWRAYCGNEIVGRCVRLAYDDAVSPPRHYHWGICRDSNGAIMVQDFWHVDIWTTTRYRKAFRGWRCPEL